MAKQYDCLSEQLTDFIARQPVFFTATAAPGARVNISPREGAALRVADAQTVLYRDRTGSGMETAAHLKADGRMTIMLCAFAGPPMILRLFGHGTTIPVSSSEFDQLHAAHYGAEPPLGTRQIVRLDIDLVQTSCGYGVPLLDHVGERPALDNWAANKGSEGIRDWWEAENRESIDGLPTGFPR